MYLSTGFPQWEYLTKLLCNIITSRHWYNPLIFRILEFYFYLCVCAYVYLVPSKFITCVGLCIYHPSQDTEHLHYHKDCLRCPFNYHIHFSLLFLSPSSQQCLVTTNLALHSYTFVISRIVHKWNRVIHNLWVWLLSIIPSRSNQVVYQQVSPV